MRTEIESFLFGAGKEHALVEICFSEKRLALAVAPWERINDRVNVSFSQARITCVDTYADNTDDLNLPWDIIAFDCRPLSHEAWEFVLHCDAIEWVFEAHWPERIGR
ncbi:hypothetical protein [Planctomyces sp. SH-PL14]|uniref:hypothetical protein n=1 Tax=Planctomyces sp. SH-PL14 TaxID=1632864 RepID=UPI00078B631A|nr:hypothetical protein [Planctomyces sp. SH-PL14]AMV16341.1 hypothetical protein VT03_00530 [Planctomyces sp. SH-PL14]